MKLPVTAFLAAVLLATPTPAAAQTREVPYKDFYEQLVKFEARPNTERLVLRSSLRDADEVAGAMTMTVLTADGPVDVPVDEEGAFTMPMNPDWVEEGARIEIGNAPKEVEVRVQVGMKLPDPTTFTYADMLAAFEQFDGVIEQEAGLLAFAVPSAKTLRVHCGSDCTATLRSDAGETVIRADDRGRVNIGKDRKLKRQNPTIILSKPARYTSISTKE